MLCVRRDSCFYFQGRPSNQVFKEKTLPAIYRPLAFEFSLSPKHTRTHARTVNFLHIPSPCGRPLFPVCREVRGLERGAPLHLLSPAKKEKPWHSKAVFSSSLSQNNGCIFPSAQLSLAFGDVRSTGRQNIGALIQAIESQERKTEKHGTGDGPWEGGYRECAKAGITG